MHIAPLAPLVVLAILAASPEAPAESFDPWTETARYEIEYRADLSSLPAGESRRVWIPVPAETSSQRVLSQSVESPWPHRVTVDSYGNRFLYLELGARELGAGQPAAAGDEAVVTARYILERSPARVSPASVPGSGDRDDPKRYLASARKIPLDGLIAEIAAEQSRGLSSKNEKLRAYYDYVYDTMTYSKHGDGWGRGDALWACSSKYGNCTDFHSLYIGMARSQGIPARFTIGFPIDPEAEGVREGYHCWAEVHNEGEGWIPFDASEAKKAGRREDYFGHLPSDRVEFMLGRDLELVPKQAGEPVNFFIYPYAEVDGKTIEKLPARLSFRRKAAELTSR